MIRVAILGAAHSHVAYALDEVAAREDVELVAAAESDPHMRAQFLSGIGDVPVYDRIEELLSEHEIDVALVAGVYSDRAEAVLAALDANAHVIADKPLCTSLEDLDRIESRMAASDRHLSIVFEKRFYPPTREARRLLDAGVLGELAIVASTGPHKLNLATRPDWFLQKETYGGIAADLPVHDIDLILTLTGATSGTVSAVTGGARRPNLSNFDDRVAVLLSTADVVSTVEATWLGPEASDVHGHYRMRLTGTEGTAELDWAYNTLVVETHSSPRQAIELPPASRPAAYFFDAIAAGREPEITTAQSLRATRVALLAQASADDNGSQRQW